MPTTTNTKLKKKKRNQKVLWLLAVSSLLGIIILACLFIFFFTATFDVRKFVVTENSQTPQLSSEDLDNIQKSIEQECAGKNIFLINISNISDLVKGQVDSVKEVKINRNFKGVMSVNVFTYEPKFVACESERQFLIACMYGEDDGIFYKESENGYDDAKKIGISYFEIDRGALMYTDPDRNTPEDLQNIDSLVGTRIYTENDMRQVFALVNFFAKEGYILKKVTIKGLRVVEIETDKYLFVTSLEKGYDETVKDYEVLKTNPEANQIFGKADLERIDLSYKNKIFYKVHVAATTSLLSTSTATTSLNISTSTPAQ